MCVPGSFLLLRMNHGYNLVVIRLIVPHQCVTGTYSINISKQCYEQFYYAKKINIIIQNDLK